MEKLINNDYNKNLTQQLINNDKEKRESKLKLENKMRHVIQRFAIFDHFAYTEHLECGVYLRKVIIE